MSTRSTMNPTAQWIVWSVLGAANALLFGIGGVLLVVLLLGLGMRVALQGDPASASSGLFIGFGATWLALIALQSSTGGHLDEADLWLAVGIVPVAVGLLFAVMRLIRGGPIARRRE